MKHISINWLGAALLLAAVTSGQAQDWQISESLNLRFNGSLGTEGWYFPRKSPRPDVSDHLKQVAGRLDLTLQFDAPLELRCNQRFQYDFDDSNRNRFEIEDLYLDYFNSSFEARAGFQIFSWKTVETVSQADFLNQTDLESDLMDADKFAELALRLRFIPNPDIEQVFSVYYFPRMRATRYPVGKNRFAFGIDVRNSAEYHLYQSSAEEWRPQIAISYERPFFEQVDTRFFYFNGYHRFPGISLRPEGATFIPVQEYRLVHKLGATFQGEIGSWLVKGEMVYTDFQKDVTNQLGQTVSPKFFAYTVGFEYTFYAALVRNQDVGAIIEIIGDTDTGKDPAELADFRPFRNHIFGGLRYAFNNIGDRSLLFGGFFDYREGDVILSAEYEERLAEVFTINFTYLDLIVDTTPLNLFSQNDRLQLEIQYHF